MVAFIKNLTVDCADAVATTNRALAGRPDQAVWWPLRQLGSRRVRLIDLAGLPLPPGAEQRATAHARWQAEQRALQQAEQHQRAEDEAERARQQADPDDGSERPRRGLFGR